MSDFSPPSDPPGREPDDTAWSAVPPPPPPAGWGSPTRGWDGTTPPAFGPPPPPPSWPGALPPPPGQPPYWAPSRNAPAKGARVALGLGAVLLLGVVALVVYARTSGSDDYPGSWDPKVADLVDFVEDERGLEFEHPVYVDFLSSADYSDAVRVDAADLSDEEAESLDQETSFLRALGLAEGEVDLAEASNDMADAGTLAYYDLVTRHVVVRGQELDVDLRVTLVHELTHALQDQHFDLGTLQDGLDVDPDDANLDVYGGYQALVEGDAVRIENAYVGELPDDEFDEYVESYDSQVEESEDELGDVPAALQASMLVPYMLGQPLVDLIAADGGNDAVDDAFDQLPSTGEHLLDPRSYFDNQGPTDLDVPELPDDIDDSVDEGTFGAVDLYVLLAERLDPLVALHATDGWGNARYVTYEDDDDRICVRFAVDNDSTGEARELADALQGWVDASPEASDAEIVDGGDGVTTVQSCDPGADGPEINDRALDALLLPTMRSQFILEAVDYGDLEVDEAWPYGNCMIDELGYEKTVEIANVTDANADELFKAVETATSACLADVGEPA